MSIRRFSFCTAALALAALSTAPAATDEQAPTPSPITLDVPFATVTRAFDISESGDVVGLYASADAKVHGFLLTRGVYTTIDGPNAIRTNALGVADLRPAAKRDDNDTNHAGRRLVVVGRYDTPNPANPAAAITHGYVLGDGVLAPIDHPLATTFTNAAGVNSSGHIVGRYLGADNVFRGFLLVDGEFTTPVGLPEPMYGIAINDRGDIAGYYGDATGRSHGFVLRNGTLTTIDPPDSMGTGQNGGVIGINSREVVGYYRFQPATPSSNGLRAFVYSLRDGSFETFALPDPTRQTCFFGINRRGDIVGSFVDDAGREHGLLMPRGGVE